MPSAKPKYTPTPRILNARQVAIRLGMSESGFVNRRPGLETRGFPQRDDFLQGWDANAIEAWLDRRSGLALVPSNDDWKDV